MLLRACRSLAAGASAQGRWRAHPAAVMRRAAAQATPAPAGRAGGRLAARSSSPEPALACSGPSPAGGGPHAVPPRPQAPDPARQPAPPSRRTRPRGRQAHHDGAAPIHAIGRVPPTHGWRNTSSPAAVARPCPKSCPPSRRPASGSRTSTCCACIAPRRSPIGGCDSPATATPLPARPTIVSAGCPNSTWWGRNSPSVAWRTWVGQVRLARRGDPVPMTRDYMWEAERNAVQAEAHRRARASIPAIPRPAGESPGAGSVPARYTARDEQLRRSRPD